MRTLTFAALALAGVAMMTMGGAPAATGQATPTARAWQDSTRSPEQRAEALLRAMTLEEKAGQVSQQFMFGAFEEFAPVVRDGKVGSLLFVTDPAVINRFQKIAVEQTRLKIPLIFGYDVIHGFRTIFPVPIGNAASWTRHRWSGRRRSRPRRRAR